MSTFKRARLKYNLLSYGGGILFGAAAMAWIILGLALAGVHP